jgi:hypothetical protein
MSVFDEILDAIRANGYHNHRKETHSNIVSRRIVADLRGACAAFANDCETGGIRIWERTHGPDDRTTDLVAGPPNDEGKPDLTKVRLLVENKSVVTAHRNRNARYQDIDRERLSAHRANPKTIVIATLMVGVCERVLNIPDCVSKFHSKTFKSDILPRLSTGDQTLWAEFDACVGKNTPEDPAKTVAMFRALPTRQGSDTHLPALDYLLIAPFAIDNVNPPELVAALGIDAEADYQRMIQHISRTYTMRWHDGA